MTVTRVGIPTQTRSAACRRAAIVLALVPPIAFAACESTQDKSAKLARSGNGVFSEKGIVVRSQSKDVKVLSTDVVQDSNGTATVVEVKNTSRSSLAQVPVAIDVTGTGGKSVFRNDQPGLEPTLAHVPLLRSHQTLLWVNDQVSPTARARSVKARIGAARTVDAGSIPKITLTGVRLERDPVSGLAAVGFVANRSKVEQRKLVIFAIARRTGRIVAAGRAQVNRLKPRKRSRFQVFFIGNPSGAHLALAAPPTSLG
jgi:hypothetical protein